MRLDKASTDPKRRLWVCRSVRQLGLGRGQRLIIGEGVVHRGRHRATVARGLDGAIVLPVVSSVLIVGPRRRVEILGVAGVEELSGSCSVVPVLTEPLRPRIPRIRSWRIAERADKVPHLCGVRAPPRQQRCSRRPAHRLVAVRVVEDERLLGQSIRVRGVGLVEPPQTVDDSQVVEDDKENVHRTGRRRLWRGGRWRGGRWRRSGHWRWRWWDPLKT
mmetsp:Transcript_27384/g.71836  ORF Transcript_27384/g.71836 Transcript_27384/m.71836 type:complete len:218 (+) Transcript_27384:2216-2869(+)